MHITNKNRSYILKAWNGQSWSFHSLSAMARALEKEGTKTYWLNRIGFEFEYRHPSYLIPCNGYYRRVRGGVARLCSFIIRSDIGEEISPWSLPWSNTGRNYYKRQVQHTAIRRQDPVPGVHCHRYQKRRQPPATLQEKRAGCDSLHEEFVRPVRRPKRLPSGYDMHWRKNQRSWKHYRATQWKEKS